MPEKHSSSMKDLPPETPDVQARLSESSSRLIEEATDWAHDHPKTTIALGLVVSAGIAGKFVLPKILDHNLGAGLLSDAVQATSLAPGSKLISRADGFVMSGSTGNWVAVLQGMVRTGLEDNKSNLVAGVNGMVRTYSDGSKIWFSTERQRFGLKLAKGADSRDIFVQKLSEMVKLGNHRNDFGFFRSGTLRNEFLEGERTRRYHDLLFNANTEEILSQISLQSKFINAGGEALVLKTTKGTALRIQPLGRTERLVDPDSLKAMQTHRGFNWQVEELPLTNSKNITQAEMDATAQRVRSRGYDVWDDKPSNFGRLANGRVVFIDPGCVLRPL